MVEGEMWGEVRGALFVVLMWFVFVCRMMRLGRLLMLSRGMMI